MNKESYGTSRRRGAKVDKTLLALTDFWDWQLQGACRNADPQLFFYPEGEKGKAKRTRDSQARQICNGCPVIVDCRSQALRVREPYGVWGGLTEEDRELIYKGETTRQRLQRRRESNLSQPRGRTTPPTS